MNVSNAIALLHVALLPFIIYLILLEMPFPAILLLGVLVLLNLAEKKFSRKKKVKSFIHPFSDKIVVLALLLVFTIQGSFSKFILSIFIFRDVMISVIRIAASRDDLPIRGELYGKLITSLQFTLVFSILLRLSFTGSVLLKFPVYIITAVALMLSFFSIIHYGYVYIEGLRTRKIQGRKIEQEKMVILANRKSGGYRDVYRRRLLKIFSRKRDAPIIYLPEKKNMYEGIDREIADYKEVIIAGGDGSFEGALNYKPLNKKSLGFFPMGAGNLYYSYFYKGKRFEYLRSRFKFHEVALDIMEVDWEGGKLQTTLLGVGVDAEVIKRIKDKKNHSFADYFFSSAEIAFSDYKAKYDLECEVDGKNHHWSNTINMIIGKVPYLGFGLRALLGKIEDDDGLILGTACVNTHSPLLNKPLRLWAILLTQLGLEKAPLLSMRGREFTIRSSELFPLQAGGEFLGYTKWLHVKVKRRQKVLMI